MTTNHNSYLYSKWSDYDDDYFLPTIPWAPHIVSYTENFQPDILDKQDKKDTQKNDWTTVVIKKRAQK